MTTRKLLVAARPRLVPQLWAQTFAQKGWVVDADDLALIAKGPDNPDLPEIYDYLEAWERLLTTAVLHENGRTWRLFQGADPCGDLFAVLDDPEGPDND